VGEVVRVVLVALSGAAALTFGLRALRHWSAERAGRAYELAVDRAGTALRAGAAGLAAVVAGVLAFPLLGVDLSPDPAAPAGSRAAAPVPDGVPDGVPAPPPPPRTPAPAPPPPEVRTLDHPAGGTLDQLRDGTLVWLPPQYGSPHATHLAFPVVVVHLPGTAAPSSATAPTSPSGPAATASPLAPDLFRGFTLAVQRGRADNFVLVIPAGCGHDAGALTEAAARYRVLPTRTATGVLGIDADAPCAVREALAAPGSYGAAAGISGQYPSPLTQTAPPPVAPPTAPPAAPGAHPAPPGPSNAAPVHPTSPRTPQPDPSPSAPHTSTPLLLATLTGETSARAAALRLRDALHPRAGDVRLIDGVPSRRELFAQVAGYFTEKLDGPTTTPTRTPTPTTAPPVSTTAPRSHPQPQPANPPHTAGPDRRPAPPTAQAPPPDHPDRPTSPSLPNRPDHPVPTPPTAYPPHTAPQSRKPAQTP
jgi:hypothetical protein